MNKDLAGDVINKAAKFHDTISYAARVHLIQHSLYDLECLADSICKAFHYLADAVEKYEEFNENI